MMKAHAAARTARFTGPFDLQSCSNEAQGIPRRRSCVVSDVHWYKWLSVAVASSSLGCHMYRARRSYFQHNNRTRGTNRRRYDGTPRQNVHDDFGKTIRSCRPSSGTLNGSAVYMCSPTPYWGKDRASATSFSESLSGWRFAVRGP